HKRRAKAEINVVPYIDVMLVLLIIFMVTAPLLKQGVDVDLPQAPANPLDVNSPEPLVVTVDKSGRYFLNASATPDSALEGEQLVAEIRKALSQQKTRPVMVRGDKNGVYQNVISVLVLLQQANIGSVGLVTEPGDD
ncbi:MAG: protein TolR, partial [Gammaproteobacteria bacterium]|nr:protein TolR [Gammaproteobacteria bacterium]